MVRNPTDAYKRIRVPCIINIACLLHVPATLLAILVEVHYKGYISNVFETMHTCKTLSFHSICFKIIKCGILVTLVEHFFSVCYLHSPRR